MITFLVENFLLMKKKKQFWNFINLERFDILGCFSFGNYLNDGIFMLVRNGEYYHALTD